MTPGMLLRNEAEKWLAQAAKDCNAAQLLILAEPSRSTFHSQQAAEKAIKAFLTYRQIVFRKTHDLTDLGSQCIAADPTLKPILKQVQDLTDYASIFRYPDAPYEPDSAEAQEALTIATLLCKEVKQRLDAAIKP